MAARLLDHGSSGTLTERNDRGGRASIAQLDDVAAIEAAVLDLLEVRPGCIARDVVAGGDGTFTAEDMNRRTYQTPNRVESFSPITCQRRPLGRLAR